MKRRVLRFLDWLVFGPDCWHRSEDFDDPVDEYRQQGKP